ncbi:MAG TPA: DUF1616 domain-containing protein [Ktedonobacteraceae bacterium]|jgi:uncharacterized membrane protein|nr:DUF1616 domain-containing protein [Ktedonobacteraceae bacterium]
MRLKNLDLLIVMIFVVINVVWLQVPNRPVLPGIAIALPLTFFFSGYALAQTLFRRHVPESTQEARGDLIRRPDLLLGHPVGRADQILLSFGLSMAIDVLVGFALNILPIGLQAQSWVISLGLITTICTVLAFFLRRKDIPGGAAAISVRISVQDVLLFLLALLVVASSVWLAIARPLNPQPSFTQFWMLPANQTSKTCAVSLGAQNFETTSKTYRVVMTINNVQTNTWSSIVLTPQQKWVQAVPVNPGSNSTLSIEAQLYRTDNPGTAYRDVHMTFYIASTENNGKLQQQCVLGSQS